MDFLIFNNEASNEVQTAEYDIEVANYLQTTTTPIPNAFEQYIIKGRSEQCKTIGKYFAKYPANIDNNIVISDIAIINDYLVKNSNSTSIPKIIAVIDNEVYYDAFTDIANGTTTTSSSTTSTTSATSTATKSPTGTSTEGSTTTSTTSENPTGTSTEGSTTTTSKIPTGTSTEGSTTTTTTTEGSTTTTTTEGSTTTTTSENPTITRTEMPIEVKMIDSAGNEVPNTLPVTFDITCNGTPKSITLTGSGTLSGYHYLDNNEIKSFSINCYPGTMCYKDENGNYAVMPKITSFEQFTSYYYKGRAIYIIVDESLLDTTTTMYTSSTTANPDK